MTPSGTAGGDSSKCLDASSISRDEDYYFSGSDDSLVFLVENRLFRVHTSVLKTCKSAMFQDMLSLAPSDGEVKVVEGSSDAAPIVVPQVTAFEFKTFLDLFYKPMLIHPFNQDQWAALLSVTHRFQIPIDHESAVRELTSLKPTFGDAKLVELADNFDVPMSLIKSALTRLIMRDQPFSAPEIERMSIVTIVKLVEARELFRNERRRDEAHALSTINQIFFLSPSPPSPPASSSNANNLFLFD